MSNPDMQKIIIRTPNFIGDTINTTPCIELIMQEYPDAKITIVGPDFVRSIFKYNPRITDYITFPLSTKGRISTWWHLWRSCRKQKGDLGIIFINTFTSALLFKLASVKCNIGYKNEGRGFLLDYKPKLNRNIHYINRYATLFNQFLNNKYTRLPELYLPVSGECMFNFKNPNRVVGLYLGGENKKFRRYPDEPSVKLIQLLHQNGYNIILVGDKNDAIKHQQYEEQAQISNLINLTGKTNIEGLFNAIAQVDVLITIDSAALHVAAATKTKFIGLMGLSTSPTSTITPKVSFGKVLKVEGYCIREEEYINNITPESIITTLSSIL